MLDEVIWNNLISQIKKGRCTPFLGAGASMPAAPSAAAMARKWAAEYEYPFADTDNLMAVSQFIAVKYRSPLKPKDLFLEELEASEPPAFRDGEPHSVLADLPFPVYMTTNYDDFMVRALGSLRSPKNPQREFCRWHDTLKNEPSVFDGNYSPSPSSPVVFHLHGHTLPQSLVLTEDDYLTFLAAIARDPQLLPARIQQSLNLSVCLFIGYRLADWNFRVLFQGLRANLGLTHIAVLKPPSGDVDSIEVKNQQAYLKAFYARMNLEVYWGTAQEFCIELDQRYSAKYP